MLHYWRNSYTDRLARECCWWSPQAFASHFITISAVLQRYMIINLTGRTSRLTGRTSRLIKRPLYSLELEVHHHHYYHYRHTMNHHHPPHGRQCRPLVLQSSIHNLRTLFSLLNDDEFESNCSDDDDCIILMILMRSNNENSIQNSIPWTVYIPERSVLQDDTDGRRSSTCLYKKKVKKMYGNTLTVLSESLKALCHVFSLYTSAEPFLLLAAKQQQQQP
jgi:hypothetical protein